MRTFLKLFKFIFVFFLGFFTHQHYSKDQTSKDKTLNLKHHKENNKKDNITSVKKQKKQVLKAKKNYNIESMMNNNKIIEIAALVNKSSQNGKHSSFYSYKDQILKTLIKWFNNNELSKYENFCLKYLELNDEDGEIYQKLGELYTKKNNHIKALNAMYRSRNLQTNADKVNELDLNIDKIIIKHHQQLIEEKKYEELYDFYQFVLNEDYSKDLIQIYYSQLLILLHHFDEASSILNHYTAHKKFGKKARTLIEKIKKLEAYKNSEKKIYIKLKKLNRQFLINAKIADEISIDLLIDTGASLTAINQDVLDKISSDKISLIDHKLLNTANGVIKSPIYKISLLEIAELKSFNTKVVGLKTDLKSSENKFYGLLGMDFLGQFKMEIDQENSQLVLQPKNLDE
tara:strand:- start:604 stop:1806 length:1203 start_codon:yes stop_codon:yes gene_type:complete